MNLDWLALPNLERKSLTRQRLLPAAALVALLAATPLVYMILQALSAEADTWQRLWQARIGVLLKNTLLLTATVTGASAVIGVGMAWLTERSDLPGQKAFRWLLALPLAIPPYIGAIIHLALMRPRGGILPRLLGSALGTEMPHWNSLGFGGAAFILTLFSFPYIYLLCAAGFRSLNASLEDAARTLGRTPWQTFWFVVLPTLQPAVAAGMLLVALDVLAEYGTVALLRYETFTSAIFTQLIGRYDRSAASALSGTLVALAALLFWIEVHIQGQAQFTQVGSHWRPARKVSLGRWRIPAFLSALTLVTISLLTPAAALTIWSLQALLDAETSASIFRFGAHGFGAYTWNSLWSAGLAALCAVVLSLPVALAAARYPSRMARFLSGVCQIGYALPGVVIALSLLFLVNRFLPLLHATPLVIVLAYTLRHMPQAIRGSTAAFSQISPVLEEASRSLGHSSLHTFSRVTLPLAFPGMLAGGALVFLTSLKELPATLLLRPAGFDTLAVRAWIWAGEGFYPQAAPAALTLVLISAIPLSLLLHKDRFIP